MNYWWLIPALIGLSFFLTAALRRYALSRKMLDIPNVRSSHSVPTPRGGGVAIVLSFSAALIGMFAGGLIPSTLFYALTGAGMLTAVVGFLDDHGHIAARWRLLAHFASAIWAVAWLGGLPAISLYGFNIYISWIGYLFAVVYLVWMLNLYNFMDGIDGIAGVEAMTVCLCGCLLYWINDTPVQAWSLVALASCVAGFLLWNFPPAKIFMGDAGSGFLGMALGVLSLQAAWTSPKFFWAWLILLGVFIVDATFTLLRRLLRGDKVYEAHRSHAYQFASRQFGAHLPVTLAVGVINILWLLPAALCLVIYDLDGATVLTVAYVPLVFLALKFRAGELERSTV
ncbi:MraY family glycosyltransferase [Pseudomonas extremaustralis]|uniref:MraY family glycosyltransferase n=1 Tax=Pseudomonas extremaustralis TaxID=359110 RepID=UPI002307BFA3|nr:glycosyltransferase family 4 protein [Pseudomonas extremaustralis]MDB1111399.1 glycosyltransferase family 4 protein [Pseudomonas extremaustralis]